MAPRTAVEQAQAPLWPVQTLADVFVQVDAITGVSVLLKQVPGLTLMWLGIVGAAITLFANLLAPLDMADWAWWIVQIWQEATQEGWGGLARG